MTTSELRSFPPVNDTIDWVKQVDWQDVKRRSIAGINNVGLVLALIGEKTYEFGVWLGKVGEEKQAEDPSSEFIEIPDFPSIRK